MTQLGPPLADALTRWLAAPTVPIRQFSHEVDASSKAGLAKPCPVGHAGCSLDKRRKEGKNWYVGTYGCPAYPIHLLPGWPDHDDDWRQAWLTPEGRLIGNPSVSLRGPKWQDLLASAKEKEGALSDLRIGQVPLVLFHHHTDMRSSPYPEVRDMAETGLDQRLRAIIASLA